MRELFLKNFLMKILPVLMIKIHLLKILSKKLNFKNMEKMKKILKCQKNKRAWTRKLKNFYYESF